MIILGLAGGFDRLYESFFDFGADLLHDAAAVIVRDGEVVAGIEEERLNRIKHTNKIWHSAVRFCLQQADIRLEELDLIAVYVSEAFLDESLKQLRLVKTDMAAVEDGRAMYQYLFRREFGVDLPREKFSFVNHHLAHAATAYYMSGFEQSLVLTIDGSGDNVSTTVVDVRANTFNTLMTKPVHESLGFFYLDVIRFLGYRIFDEYKVMGLAPYGDANRFADQFSGFYTLLPNGDYTLHREKIVGLYEALMPRHGDQPFEQIHKDLAAALQQALETIVMHMLSHFQQTTGHKRLALAGGVGQNSSMNGKIMQSGLFEKVFAPSFAADSGCAFGAAMYAAHCSLPELPFKRVPHAYWGTPTLAGDDLYRTLAKWQAFATIEKMTDRADRVSDLMIAGKVVGWVQGRSEFGPRALGNRSIIADPRLGSHKETINAMIKMRESYRPFAPSVLEEYVGDFFDVPGDERDFPFMAFVLPVKSAHRDTLAAITHVDGSARLQTVSKVHNPEYWELIDAFRQKTGIAMVLNTSFNNHAEPIVDSADDAMVCYLTSGLDYLVVGDCLLTKKAWGETELKSLIPALPKAARLIQEDCYRDNQHRSLQSYIEWNYGGSSRRLIPNDLYRVLQAADGKMPLQTLMAQASVGSDNESALYEAFQELWSSRYIVLTPSAVG
ncbi:carbamoyltransferase C-terminal domain-containing protein [Methylomonas sp. UP202]|uniref:carbamoyltransferase family protein n=1 Tax=Methylomonas sp. UP202 TaxID=3040943 RepID=UPI00247A9B47|nr:carbamoyltransferase C-terminal domain-containing protein [Methylomonas sp. UP202]WGS85505.1 carbamoyltransferase C-terminal domain-containing protein [Methylomonas sp. UP202]